MVRILHMGDLHLDSPFSAFSVRAAAMRREKQFAAFEQLVQKGLESKAQLLLLAGDCFDTTTPLSDTVRRFFDFLGTLPLDVVIAPGNHDYYVRGGFWESMPLPSNVHLFQRAELDSFDFPTLGVTVFGFAFEGETQQAPSIAAKPQGDRVAVLLAHSDITTPLSPYAPLVAGQFEASPFAYAALGHIHKHISPCCYGKTVTAYSGFLCGRGFDETGKGHANLVELDGDRVKVLPLESNADTFEILRVDCTGALSGEEARGKVRGALDLAKFKRSTAVRVILSGEVGADCHIDGAALAALGEKYALFDVADETIPLFDADYLEKDVGLRGAFYRALLPKLSSVDAAERDAAAEALRIGLAALSGREVSL